jgi:peptidoglycan-associated lipoprotein
MSSRASATRSTRRSARARSATRPTWPRGRPRGAPAGGARQRDGGRRSTLLAAVYFDYDASELRGDSRAALEAKLPIMERFGELRVRVAGHTDDRGSDEYNLALGQRRAASVKRFLTERGVDDAASRS